MRRKWCILIHNIPARPLYLRAKVRQKMARLGAVALKNSVYVLPRNDDALEDFQWLAQEIGKEGGQAFVTAGEILGGISETELVARFRSERSRDYALLAEDIRRAKNLAALARLRHRLTEIRAVDFFRATAGKEIERMLERLEKKLKPPPSAKKTSPAKLKGSIWVTRRGIKVDRISSAWLVRRFIDGSARFRFVDPDRWEKRPGEIAFDMSGGDYTHEGDRCTFETILAKFRIKDRALRPIAEIVHDVDMKDKKYDRADTAGIHQLLEGILSAHAGDQDRLDRGFALFDDLYRSFQRGKRG